PGGFPGPGCPPLDGEAGHPGDHLHQAGVFANFSLSLGCVVADQSAQSSFSYHEGATQEVQGVAQLSLTSSGSSSSSQGQSAGGIGYTQTTTAGANACFVGTFSYDALATQTSDSSSAGSYTLHQEGTFAAGLYSLGCFSLDQSGQSTFAAH